MSQVHIAGGFGLCRSCGARIVWATTATGRTMPVDRDTTPDGNTLLYAGIDHYSAVVHAGEDLARARERWPDKLHMPHHATCPHAARHRRKTKGRS